MANLKISQLTATTQNTIGSWVVINNSGETTSNKSQLEYVLGMTKGAGNSSIKSNDFLTEKPSIANTAYSIALGNGASATTGPSQVIIGNSAYGQSENVIAIGKNAHDQGTGRDDGIAIGTDAEIYQPRAIAIGKNAAAVTDSITLGTDGRAIATSSIAIGQSTVVAGTYGVGIGYDIFQDRDNASVIGAQSYVSGADSTVVGANSKLGQTGGDSDRSTIVGVSNDIQGPGDDMVAVGYDNTLTATGAIAVGNNYTIGGTYSIGIGGVGGSMLGSSSPYSILMGGSGNTYSVQFGQGNIKIGGFNDSYPYTPQRGNIWIGGSGNTYNALNGLGQNNVFLGLKGQSINNAENTTFVENLVVYGSQTNGFTTYTGTSISIDLADSGFVEVSALDSGSTYTISVSPAPNNIGRTLELFIEYVSGATVNFDGSGLVQWRWNPQYGTPVFSATTGQVTRSIIVLNTWDGSDMWEVSRSMNMV